MLESSIASEKTKPAHAMFKATMNDARLFRNLLGAISSLIEEADFNATPEGIKLRSMDPSHIAMVDFEWPKTAFDTYECNGNTKLRLSVSNLLKLLKRTRSDESIEVVYDDTNKKLNITLKNKITRKFITPTLEPSTEEVPTPKVPFNARVKITAASLRDIIDDAQAISDNVKLEVTPDKFTVRATGELSSALIELDKGSDAILDIDAKEPTKATYNLNYLGEIIRAGSGASEVTSLEFSTNMPIKVEFEMPQQGRLLYYLAPRIESE
ncbi:proliferating cell nuclear antigen (pcna) [Candidatus Bathyarchaeota archaeon]|nr:MAG: proliferating cell nuclear antigen (pcna) [Candidatus Bathyarchaeota archaeon]